MYSWDAPYGVVQIINTGGGIFSSVVIGNPPYVELRDVKDYNPKGYTTLPCGNLYAVVVERCNGLVLSQGRIGVIVPVSSVSTERYMALQDILKQHNHWYSNFDDRPCRLFDQLEHIRLSIHLLAAPIENRMFFSTGYCRWNKYERNILFSRLIYTRAIIGQIEGTLPKLCSCIESGIIEKMTRNVPLLYKLGSNGKNIIYYSRKFGNFTQVLNFMPMVYDAQRNLRPPSEFKEIRFSEKCDSNIALLGLNASLFVWFCTVYSDCRHVNSREIKAYSIPFATLENDDSVDILTERLTHALQETSEMRSMGRLRIQCIIPRRCKQTIDKIDTLFARHSAFTENELDFIISYDIKYRLGEQIDG